MFSRLQLNIWNYSEVDLGSCLYNGVKLVSYFCHYSGSASLLSILKCISVLVSCRVFDSVCMPEMRLEEVYENRRAQISRVYRDQCSGK